jgi:hypothetical protein
VQVVADYTCHLSSRPYFPHILFTHIISIISLCRSSNTAQGSRRHYTFTVDDPTNHIGLPSGTVHESMLVKTHESQNSLRIAYCMEFPALISTPFPWRFNLRGIATLVHFLWYIAHYSLGAFQRAGRPSLSILKIFVWASLSKRLRCQTSSHWRTSSQQPCFSFSTSIYRRHNLSQIAS